MNGSDVEMHGLAQQWGTDKFRLQGFNGHALRQTRKQGYWVNLTHREFTMNYYRVTKDTGIPLIVRYKTTTGFQSALSNERAISTFSIKHAVADGLELCKFTLCIMTVLRIPEVTFPANMSSASTIDQAKKKTFKLLVHHIFFRKFHNLHRIKLLFKYLREHNFPSENC